MALRLRSSYFKVLDMDAELAFWRALLQAEPVKQGAHWSEFVLGEVRLGLLLNDFGDTLRDSSSVPVLELAPGKMQAAGARVVLDGLNNPQMRSMVLTTPGGHEFELCNCAAPPGT